MKFEDACQSSAQGFSNVVKAAGSVLSAAKLGKKASEIGDAGGITKAVERLQAAVSTLRDEVASAQSAWPFDGTLLDEYLRQDYPSELVATAEAAGLQPRLEEDRILVFPCIVRVSTGERVVTIDRKRVRGLRPSAVVGRIKATQAKKPRVSPERFVELLYRAYGLLAGPDKGATLPLARVYEALTLLPGASADYGVSEFVRDVYLVDQSGVHQTKSGAILALPGSTTTKGGRGYTFVSPTGEQVVYYGLKFTETQS